MTEFASNEETVLPLWVVIDTSMTTTADRRRRHEQRINGIVPAFVGCSHTEPIVDNQVRMTLVVLGADAKIAIPDARLSTLGPPPLLTPADAADYGAMFRLLRDEIPLSVARFKAMGYIVARPTVVLFTEGKPTDEPTERASAFTELTDVGFKSRPNIFVVGFPAADAHDLTQYVQRRGRVFLSTDEFASESVPEAFIDLLCAPPRIEGAPHPAEDG